MNEFAPGQRVRVRDSTGKWLARVAASDAVNGRDFPVVWLCREEEWRPELADGVPLRENGWKAESDFPCVPWPVEDVEAMEEQP